MPTLTDSVVVDGDEVPDLNRPPRDLPRAARLRGRIHAVRRALRNAGRRGAVGEDTAGDPGRRRGVHGGAGPRRWAHGPDETQREGRAVPVRAAADPGVVCAMETIPL